MPTQITQRESGGRTYLQVEGDMLVDDALLLERLASDIHEDSGVHVTVDLADLDFLDSDSAPILKRLENQTGISIEGLEIFLQSAIDAAERNAASSKSDAVRRFRAETRGLTSVAIGRVKPSVRSPHVSKGSLDQKSPQ
jgi:hypothetical protein